MGALGARMRAASHRFADPSAGRLLSPEFPVVDFHCHVPAPDFVPEAFRHATVRTIARNLELRGAHVGSDALGRMVEDMFRDPQCDRLVDHMDTAGVAHALLVVPDFSYRLGGTAIDELLVRTAAITRRHAGRFSSLAGIDPRWGADGAALFERAVDELGFVGLKVYPPCGVHPSDRALYPFYEICASRGLIVMVHTGGSASCLDIEPGRPLGLDAAARDFPSVNFVLAHGLANLLDETITLCTFRPNVFVDLSALPSGGHDAVREAMARGVTHRLLYGSDWPVFRAQGGFSAQLDGFLAVDGPLGGVGREQLERIFGRTARELLGSVTSGDPSPFVAAAPNSGTP